ncbi:cyclophilin-like fold protein [uncultured Treponema sp.]|uniref:cyclophilin-like fold protein n=1 Tax=uncultured Treponema sp. TaxID=162155 RepID=UPI00258FC21A|nr:cyclophilin-like fold protein [uncultured Treponema sp.]
MKKLLLSFLFSAALAAGSCAFAENAVNGENMKISVSDGKNKIVYELNASGQSKSLYSQLPIKVQIENYSTNEKIFYPKEKIPLKNGIEGSGDSGTLAYFSPWGNIVLFYGKFSEYPGLFILGKAVSGAENIKNLSGIVSMESEK